MGACQECFDDRIESDRQFRMVMQMIQQEGLAEQKRHSKEFLVNLNSREDGQLRTPKGSSSRRTAR